MEFIKRKCTRCGYEIEVPDTTVSVICGSCGKINSFGRLSSLLKVQMNTEYEAPRQEGKSPLPPAAGKTSKDRPVSGVKTGDIKPIPSGTEGTQPPAEEDEEYPEQGSATKILTLVFILAPFIAMAVERFKLPPYAAFIAVAAIILIVFFLKKRS